LAPGDKFTTSDYVVVVTEITSGSPAGYNGRGYIEFKFLNGIVLKQISVLLKNTVVNDCYQHSGGTIETEYDPEWKGITDVDGVIFDLLTFFRESLIEFKEILNTFDNSCDEINILSNKIKEYELAFSKSNTSYTEPERLAMIQKIAELKTRFNLLLNCTGCTLSSSNLKSKAFRTSTPANCGPNAQSCIEKIDEMLDDANIVVPTCDDTKRINTMYAILKNPEKIAAKYPNFVNGAAAAIMINMYFAEQMKIQKPIDKYTFEYGIAKPLNLEIFDFITKGKGYNTPQKLDYKLS
jgi:hypothetical protein